MINWVEDKEHRNGLVLDQWELSHLISQIDSGWVGKTCSKKRLTPAEELALTALRNLEQDYRRKRNYYERRMKQESYRAEAQQLAQQLLEVTEERDTLLEKIKEAQVTAGLFIKSVKEKLGLEK